MPTNSNPLVPGHSPAETLHDYNGICRWSVESVQSRYLDHCRQLGIKEPEVPRPKTHAKGKERWIYPIMDSVIVGMKKGDRACIELGVEFLEKDEHFPFGKILKSNTARELRRAELSSKQIARLRERIVKMLLNGNVPHEFQQYAKLLRRIGLGNLWPTIEQEVKRDNPYVMRYYDYLRLHASTRKQTDDNSSGG
jgi:hypothetical protein